MKLKKASIIFIICLVLFAAVAFGLKFAVDMYENKFNVSGEQPQNLDVISGNSINFLLVGSDKSGVNTDVIMLCSYNKEENKIKLLSIPRDTRILINGKPHKINACMAYGGIDRLLTTVKDITGVPIHYYAKMDLEGFKSIVDILGGVDFDVPQDMKYDDPTQDLHIDLKKGFQHLDGDKAEQLVRFRRYAEGDIQRIVVQKDFLKALIEQKFNASLVVNAPKLFSEVSKYVKTNISGKDIVSNLKAISLMNKEDAVEIFSLPGIAQYVGGISYYLHNVDQTLELMKTEFGGSGQSDMRDTYLKEYNKITSSPNKSATTGTKTTTATNDTSTVSTGSGTAANETPPAVSDTTQTDAQDTTGDTSSNTNTQTGDTTTQTGTGD